MSLNLNPWFALILGILIGWLLNWLLGMLFYRKRNVEFEARLVDAETQLKTRDTELDAERARTKALEADLAAGAPATAALPEAEVEAPAGELMKAAAVVGLAGAAGELAAETPSAEAPAGDVSAVEVEAETPVVEAGLSGAAIAAPGVGLGGAAVAAAGLAAVALTGDDSEAAVETPETAGEASEVRLEPIEVEPSEVEAEMPGMTAAATGIELGGAAVVAAGVGAVALASQGDDEPDTRAGEVVVAANLPTPVARIEADDLTQVKGIGPKYAASLNAAGITTYAALAHTSPDRLKEIVDAPAWRQVDYPAWIVEARALAEAPRRMVVGDDFTTLEGIGPVYEAKLKHAGIATFAQLAATDEASLKEIIQAPAWRRVNYGEWIEQAKLAAAGDDAGLKALQAELFSRGGDNIALIAGVGEKSAAALNAAGITTYAALAESTPEQLAAITAAAGVRAGDFDGWIEEARLRAAGKRVKRATRGAGITNGPKVPCPQDLSRISGIGAVYETKLYAAGIGTYWELSEIADQDLVRVLEVQDFQAVDIVAVKADALKLAEETDTVGRYWDGTPPDDFEKLEGIGEVYERRLYDAGICTFRALAGVSAERLQEICQAPDWRRPDYASWIAQAERLIA